MVLLRKIIAVFQRCRLSVKRRLLKRSFASCGAGFKIYGEPKVVAPESISIGEGVVLNDSCVLNATGSRIVLGDNVVVSTGAKIMAATLDPLGFVYDNRRDHIRKDIVIGDRTWICTDAIICPGIHIKGRCVVGAGAVVTKDITETDVVVAGNPAHVVKYLKKEI